VVMLVRVSPDRTAPTLSLANVLTSSATALSGTRMIAGTYDAGLVALSVLIAVVASYAAFNLAEREFASGGRRG
jgi:Bacterial signalling protein N terminal repeat